MARLLSLVTPSNLDSPRYARPAKCYFTLPAAQCTNQPRILDGRLRGIPLLCTRKGRTAYSFASRPFRHGRVQYVPDWPRHRPCLTIACNSQTHQPISTQRSGMIVSWKFNKVSDSGSLSCGVLRAVAALKPLLHFVGAMNTANARKAMASTSISKVLGRLLLSALLFASVFGQPRFCLPASACPTASADVDTSTDQSKDPYDILFEKLKQKDEEMGRVGSESGLEKVLKEQIYKLHKKLKERRNRYQEARATYEELSRFQASEFEEEADSEEKVAVQKSCEQRTQADSVKENDVSAHDEMSSMPTGLQERERAKVVSDLKETLVSIMEHKFLPEAVDLEVDKPAMEAETEQLLKKLRMEWEPSKRIIESVDKMIKEDAEAEKNSDGVFAPSFKKWKEEKKAEFKQLLQANPDIARQFAAQKKERILSYRDRVMAGTWYNEKQKRWEMASEALGYAVRKELVASARIRHDRRLMLFKLKGDDRIFYVDLQLYDLNFKDDGGFEALYLKMLLSGVPTSVEVMWIPLSQWDPLKVFSIPFKLCFRVISGILESGAISPVVVMYLKGLSSAAEEVLGRLVFPVLDKLPKLIQILIGLQLPDDSRKKSPFLMELKKNVTKRMEERFGQGEGSLAWWLALPLKCFILWIPLVYISRFMHKVSEQFLGPGEPMNVVEWKEKKGKEVMKKLNAKDPKGVEDPVRQAFDQMKRIKDPGIKLQDFAGLDMVKDEIREIVTFLKNPSLFKEMGARPPRGVLIVGQPGTGKTSLAMAIAAEAKVPMVEVDGLELEGGAWVGQGASNVRELFKTARELAPVIIFMDDFDYFAGVRGDSGDTRKQDHESLINQLLVELDGFETQEGVVLLATSSRPWNIDEALRRPGRMDRTIVLPLPNKTERELILKNAAKVVMDHELIDLVDWKEMARKTNGMTPQQLKEVPRGLESSFVSWKYTDDEELFTIFKWLATLNKLTPEWLAKTKWMNRWKSGLRDWLGLRVTKEDIEAAVYSIDVFNETRPGLELRGPGYPWTREFKYPHAVWAAGRGLMGFLLPNFDALIQIWLDPGSWEAIGFTRFRKRREGGYEETGTLTRSYYEKKLVLCFGSSAAAELLLPFGHKNNLSKFELKEAREIVSSMVMEFGWGPDDSQAVYASANADRTLSMGDDLEADLENKARQLYNAASMKATDLLRKNRKVLEAMLEHLLQFDAMSGQDIAKMFQEHGGILEQEPFTLVPLKDDLIVQASTNGTSTRVISATA